MAWTNAFNLGSCGVTVAYASDPLTTLYSGTMAKGASHSFTADAYSLSVAVSSVGVVSLNNEDTGVGIETNMLVYVTPAYSLDEMIGAKLVLASSCSGSGAAGATLNFDDTTAFDSSGGPVDVDLTDDTPYEALFAKTSGINSSQVTPVLQFTPQFYAPDPPDPVPKCKELGRVTRSFVSGYTASRHETRRIRRFSKRCVVAEFNGAMEAGRTITHVRWDCTSPWSIFMENARVETGGRSVAIDASFNFAGWGGLLATATWDNGEVTNTEFFFTVLDRPLYPGAVYDSANGPYVLEADA